MKNFWAFIGKALFVLMTGGLGLIPLGIARACRNGAKRREEKQKKDATIAELKAINEDQQARLKAVEFQLRKAEANKQKFYEEQFTQQEA